MSGFAFKITVDHIDTGRAGKTYATEGCKEIARPNRFKLYDDDGNLYYEGEFGNTDGDVSPSLGEEAFAPLEWAMNYAGCTRIDYFNPQTGAWENL